MGMRVLLTLSGVLAVVVALALLLATKSFFAGQGIVLDDQLALIGMAQGSVLLGVGVTNLAALWSRDPAGLRSVVVGNLAAHLSALGVNAHAVSAGLVGTQVWMDVTLHVILGLAFAYYLVRPPAG